MSMKLQLACVQLKLTDLNTPLMCFVCRYLKSCMWQADKRREMEERKRVQVLHRELVDRVKQNKKVGLYDVESDERFKVIQQSVN